MLLLRNNQAVIAKFNKQLFIYNLKHGTGISNFLTAVITITTIIYTFYSVRLWRTSRQAAEISRQAALGNLWSELNNYIAICKQEGRSETGFLQELSGLIAEYMLSNLLNDISTKNDPNVAAFKTRIKKLVETKNPDVTTLNWLSPLIGKK